MILSEILAKEPAVLSEEEKKFLLDNKDILSEDDKIKFKGVVVGLVEESPPAPLLEEVVVKEPTDLTEAEKTVLKATVGQLSEEQKEKFKDVLAEGSPPNPNKPYPGK